MEIHLQEKESIRNAVEKVSLKEKVNQYKMMGEAPVKENENENEKENETAREIKVMQKLRSSLPFRSVPSLNKKRGAITQRKNHVEEVEAKKKFQRLRHSSSKPPTRLKENKLKREQLK